MVEIDGETDGHIAQPEGLGDEIIHPALITAHIDLEYFWMVGRIRHRLGAGRADRTQHMHAAEAGSGAGRHRPAAIDEILH